MATRTTRGKSRAVKKVATKKPLSTAQRIERLRNNITLLVHAHNAQHRLHIVQLAGLIERVGAIEQRHVAEDDETRNFAVLAKQYGASVSAEFARAFPEPPGPMPSGLVHFFRLPKWLRFKS